MGWRPIWKSEESLGAEANEGIQLFLFTRPWDAFSTDAAGQRAPGSGQLELGAPCSFLCVFSLLLLSKTVLLLSPG